MAANDLVRLRSPLSGARRALLDQRLAGRGAPAGQRIPRKDPNHYPVSFAQQRLWFLDRLSPGGFVYNIPLALRMEGQLDINVLERALNEIVARHETLRTSFLAVNGHPQPQIAPVVRLRVPLQDLRMLTPDRRNVEVDRLIAEERLPFELARGPLIRARLLLVEDGVHILLLSMHHIVADGWSLGVFIHEFATLYQAFREGGGSPLPELDIQYGDFAYWQREQFGKGAMADQLRYWKERLSDIPPVISMPGDHPRPPVQTFRGAIYRFQLSGGLSDGLRALSRAENVTLYMTLAAAFKTLVHRYTGQDDIAIGTPIANRNRAEIEPLIGFFVNTLVLRTDLSGDPAFRALLARIREITLGAYANQDIPFERIVEELQPERNLSQQPLFQVTFALQNAPKPALRLPDLDVTVLETDNRTAKFDLALHMWEAPNGIEGKFEYSTDLFELATIERWARNFQTLLSGIVASPERRLSELPVLSPAEIHQLTVDTNQTEQTYPADSLVHALFEQQAERKPDRVAVEDGESRLSYQELNREANRVAWYLRRKGIGKDDLVGILMERSTGMVAAILGVLKAGAAYVPLDPDYPADRLSFMVRDAGLRVVLTGRRLSGLLRASDPGIHIVSVDAESAAIAREATGNPAHASHASSPAYVIYTSGSTGAPKGVVISHLALCNHMFWMASAFPLVETDRVFQKTPFSFDASVWEFYAPLLAGATLVMAKPGGHQDSAYLVRTIAKRQITILQVVPSLLRMLLDEPELSRCTSLRRLFCGGEQLTRDLQDRLHARLQCELINLYGPTETTIDATFWICRREAAGNTVPIGRPVANTQVYILDKNLRPVPPGANGELCIGGRGLALGYLRRMGLTAERFIPNPFARKPGERLYRTGDLVRFLADGTLQHLGRIDRQIKLRGHRIELAEVEATLRGHPSVRQAAALVREDAPGDARLVAYVAPATSTSEERDASVTLERAHLQQWESVFEQVHRQTPEDGSLEKQGSGTGGQGSGSARSGFSSALVARRAMGTSFDISGWVSSYTGMPIPEEEMREWQDATVERILSLRPRRVLEIGCGTGLLLLRIAPHCQTYVGADFAAAPLQTLRSELEARGSRFAHVDLLQRAADDFDGIENGSFDTIILNSVVQYFPSEDYLMKVLARATAALKPGGSIFIGDVRDYRLIDEFYTSVHLHQAPSGLDLRTLRERIARSVAQEEELLVAPRFFAGIRERVPQIRGVEAHLKRGRYRNELTCFRYDVILRTDDAAPIERPAPVIACDGGAPDRAAILHRLKTEKPEVLGITGIRNDRVLRDLRALEWLRNGGSAGNAAEIRRRIDSIAPSGVDPEGVWSLASAVPYDAAMLVSADDAGTFDAVFVRRGPPDAQLVHPSSFRMAAPASGPSSWTNHPVRAVLKRRLVFDLRDYLKERLPDYMAPSAFVLLETLPLTPNGKLDYKALPAPGPARPESTNIYAAPRNAIEEQLAASWMALLGVDRVGISDNFFELGGHSLLAAQVIARVRETFGIELPLRSLFEQPTVAGLAGLIEESRASSQAADQPPIVPVTRDGELPLSTSQQRLWFLHQLEKSSSAYNIPAVLRLVGPLDQAALQQALDALVARHEVLRTRFETRDGVPVQVVEPAGRIPLHTTDLSHLSFAERDEQAAQLVAEYTGEPFDLETGPVIRCALLRLEPANHILVLAMHHIVADGWSLGIIAKDLGAIYDGFAIGGQPHLPDLPLQYADYSVWQRQWFNSGILIEQVRYWKNHLAGVPAVLALPTDHPRPAVQTFRGAAVSFELSPGLARRVEELAREENATVFMTLLAAFQVLLFRYTAQTDFVVGTPVANRGRREWEDLVGFFVNTLALRADLAGAPSFRDLLRRVRQTALSAYAHQDLPFERLVEELQPGRDLGRNPLFQVMFALQNAPFAPLRLHGLDILPYDLPQSQTRFDLECHVWQEAAALKALLVYNTDIFERPTIFRMAGHFEQLLEGAAAEPDRSIAALALLTTGEIDQVIRQWNDTAWTPARRLSLQERIEEHALHTPDAAAIECGSERIAYGELNHTANYWAGQLIELGVGPDVTVGIYTSRSIQTVVAVLATWKAGGAYVPLDPTLPAERLAYIVKDAGVTVVLSQRSVLDGASRLNCRAICVDDMPGVPAVANPARRVSAENLAYIIYTSGSTGTPKGVAMCHGALANLIEWQLHRSIHPQRTLQFSSFSFDVCFQEIFSTLCAGATLILISEEVRRDPMDLLRTVIGQRADRIFLPFVALEQLAQAARSTGMISSSLREVITAGEQLKITRDIRDFFALLPECTLDNHYGPAEAHVVSAFQLWGSANDWPDLPPIGRPIANTRLFVLDREYRLLPVGIPGELYIAGDALARGYLGKPQLTAGKFVPDPFAGQSGSRMYRTGDQARYLPDGNIEFLGRVDRQVKFRGYRIEPGEIEATLRGHPSVRDAVAMVQSLSDGHKRLVAYVLVSNASSAPLDDIKGRLRATLPEYMIPAVVMPLEKFPLTASGKADPGAFPLPEETPAEQCTEWPPTATQEILAGFWAGLLGVDSIGPRSHYFDLGGHSLLAARLVSRINQTFGISLPLKSVFEKPVLADLAAAIEAAQQAPDGLQPPPLVPISRDRDPCLSFAQQRLWFLEQLNPGTSAYNLPAALHLYGPLNTTALEASFRELVRRHEVLRTVFDAREGEPVQVILPEIAFAIPLSDMRGLENRAREEAIEAAVLEEAQRPFDLERGPLLRARLLKLAEEHILTFVMHHIAADGWSLGIVVREVALQYNAFVSGSRATLDALPVQYADFAVWQRDWLRDDALDRQLAYWTRQLSGIPAGLRLPEDYKRPANPTYAGARQSTVLSPEIHTRLKRLARDEGATLFMTLLAAFQILLLRYTGQEDIVVGSPVANRNRPEIEGLIGFFVNTLVLRGDLRGNPTFRELLHRVRDMSLQAFAHQDLPFERLVEALQPQREMNQSPLFQVMFVLQNAPAEDLRLTGLRCVPREARITSARFDLTLAMEESDRGLLASVEYKTELFSRATIERLLAHFRTLLEGIAANPLRRLSEYPMLSSEELSALDSFHGLSEPYPESTCIHDLFARQARIAPERCAVATNTAALTYAELDVLSNRLARYLAALGVAPESRVGICVDRSLEMIVAVLGILKSGSAYVPIDPSYPEARVRFLLEDSAASVVLTQERHAALSAYSGVRTVCLDADWTEISKYSKTQPPNRAIPDNLAYLIYTSGSTGRPKGVQVTHRNVLHSTCARFTYYREEVGAYLLLSSLAFDSSVAGIFWTLCGGGTLVLPPEGAQRDFRELVSLIAQHRVTHLLCLPSLYSHLMDEGDFPSLRTVIVAGETCTPEVVERHYRLHPATLLFNEYGPTEATVWSTAYRGEKGKVRNPVPIGHAIACAKVYILDRYGQQASLGHPGELCIGGVGVARGYWNRPELTAERFVPDPFCRTAGARMYKTGDLARFLPNGDIEFLGRADQQVKIRGYRIEAGEIEALLKELPMIRDCAVIARSTSAGDLQLTAYIASPADRMPPAAEITAHLRASLPDYMVPSTIVRVDALPLGPNGKVDRLALQREDRECSRVREFVEPRNALERALTELYTQVLKVDHLGIDDDFFAMGGHSLLAIHLVSKIRKQLAIDLSLNTFFESPTVRRLAERLPGQRYDQSDQAGITDLATLVGLPALFEAVDLAKREASGTNGSTATEAMSPRLLALEKRGTRRPFFCVHPGSGSSGCYRHLAIRLGDNQPFYGFQALGLDGYAIPHPDFQSMAAAYIEAMRTVQPDGPFQLGGWSSGGLVALEMAQQLRLQGHQVSLLALMDTILPVSSAQSNIDDATILAELFEDRLTLDTDYLRTMDSEQQIQYVCDGLKLSAIVPDEFGLHWFRGYFSVFRTMYRSALSYQPAHYPGTVLLVRAGREHDRFSPEPDLGWSRVAHSVVIKTVDASHRDLLDEPWVAELAEHLRASLDEAQQP